MFFQSLFYNTACIVNWNSYLGMDMIEKKKQEAGAVVEGEAEQEEDTEESLPQAEQPVIPAPAQRKLLDINSVFDTRFFNFFSIICLFTSPTQANMIKEQ